MSNKNFMSYGDAETILTEYADAIKNAGGNDTRIKPEITEIGVRIQDGYRPYIKVDAKTIIPTFENATWEDIALVADLYYNGDVSLEDIQEKWEVGDSKTISLSATDSTAAQNVTVKIVDFAHDDLTDADTEVTKALLTLGFELSENIAIGVPSSAWSGSTGRTFCNDEVYNALPSSTKSMIKTVTKAHNTATQDKVFIPTIVEFIGRTATKDECGMSSSYANIRPESGGSRYALYQNANIRSKTMVSSSYVERLAGSSSSWALDAWQCATANNAGSYVTSNVESGFMPHFCI